MALQLNKYPDKVIQSGIEGIVESLYRMFLI